MVEKPEAATPLERALASISTLATDVLSGTTPSRFHDAAAVCQLGQALVRQFAQRVDDVEENVDADNINVIGGNGLVMDYGVMPNPRGRRVRHPNQAFAGAHDNQAQRDLALAAVPSLQLAAEGTRAQWDGPSINHYKYRFIRCAGESLTLGDLREAMKDRAAFTQQMLRQHNCGARTIQEVYAAIAHVDALKAASKSAQ